MSQRTRRKPRRRSREAGRPPTEPRSQEAGRPPIVPPNEGRISDMAEFEQLFGHCQKLMFAWCKPRLRREQDIQDVLQETWVRFLKMIVSHGMPDVPLKTVIFRMVLFTLKNYLRNEFYTKKRQAVRPFCAEEAETLTAPPGLDPVAAAEAAELWACIRQELSDEDKVLVECHLNGYDYREIARMLSCSEVAARRRMSRVRNQLSNRLSGVRE